MINLTHLKDQFLASKFVSLLSGKNTTQIHPAEAARMLNSLPLKEAVENFAALPEHSQLMLFGFLGPFLQQGLTGALPQEKAIYLLNHIQSTDRFTFYSALNNVQRSAFLRLLDEPNRKAVEDMLGYPRQSVARLVNTSFCTLNPDMTIAEAMEYLRRHHEDSSAADVVYVTDKDGKLIDDLPIRKLVLNEGGKTIRDIMDRAYVKLDIEDTTETAISRFKEYKRTVLPVTNAENKLLGIITVDTLVKAAEQRSTKEMQRFGGVETLEYPYVKTPLLSLVRKRAGWLIILFLSEMLTATAMGYFQVEIAKALVLALFIPLVMSSGGNSGSQAATLIIRALAVGELTVQKWFYVMRRELLSGLLLGMILGAIGFLRIMAWQKLGWYNYGPHAVLMAITIFFSLIGIVMWGTLSGSMIPIILKQLKQDPATSSAPFVATLVDVTGLVIYFSIAAVILRGTILK